MDNSLTNGKQSKKNYVEEIMIYTAAIERHPSSTNS